MTTFKEELIKEFKSKKLDQSQLNKLMEAQEKKSSKFMYSIFALVACLSMIFYNSMVFNLPQKIAKEVAYNHLKNMPSELITDDYALINKNLDKIEFNVKNSVKLASLSLIGARYCSIQGKTAAQIKLMSKEGKLLTLYQYEIDSDFDKEEIEIIKDNVKIKLWQEGGVHFGLAESL